MKKTIIFWGMMLLGMSTLFIGCQESEMTDLTVDNQKETTELALHKYGVFPQSEEFKARSRSNSTFETDWENLSTFTLATGQPVNFLGITMERMQILSKL